MQAAAIDIKPFEQAPVITMLTPEEENFVLFMSEKIVNQTTTYEEGNSLS